MPSMTMRSMGVEHRSKNDFIIVLPYGNKIRTEDKEVENHHNTAGSPRQIDKYTVFPEFEELWDDFNQAKLDVYDISTLYKIQYFYDTYLGEDLKRWILHQYHHGRVSTTKHLFLNSMLESIKRGVVELTPMVYADIIKGGPTYSGPPNMNDGVQNRNNNFTNIVSSTFMPSYDYDDDEGITITPPLIISRLVTTLAVILR